MKSITPNILDYDNTERVYLLLILLCLWAADQRNFLLLMESLFATFGPGSPGFN